MHEVQIIQPTRLGTRSLEVEKAKYKSGLIPLFNAILAIGLVVVIVAWLKGDFAPAADPAGQTPAAALPQVNADTGLERGKTHNLKREFAMTIDEIKAADPDPPGLDDQNAVVVGEVHWTAKNPAVRINHRLHSVGDRVIGVPEEYRVVHIQRSRVYITNPAGKLLEFPTGVYRSPADLQRDPAPGPDDMDAPIHVPGVDD